MDSVEYAAFGENKAIPEPGSTKALRFNGEIHKKIKHSCSSAL